MPPIAWPLLPGNSGAVRGEESLWFEDHPYDQDVDVVLEEYNEENKTQHGSTTGTNFAVNNAKRV